MFEKDLGVVSESLYAVNDYRGHLYQYIGRLDYDLDGLVNNKAVQSHPDAVAKVARLRNALREALKDLDRLEEELARFREAFDA